MKRLYTPTYIVDSTSQRERRPSSVYIRVVQNCNIFKKSWLPDFFPCLRWKKHLCQIFFWNWVAISICARPSKFYRFCDSWFPNFAKDHRVRGSFDDTRDIILGRDSDQTLYVCHYICDRALSIEQRILCTATTLKIRGIECKYASRR